MESQAQEDLPSERGNALEDFMKRWKEQLQSLWNGTRRFWRDSRSLIVLGALALAIWAFVLGLLLWTHAVC